jgi:hypothetical protein
LRPVKRNDIVVAAAGLPRPRGGQAPAIPAAATRRIESPMRRDNDREDVSAVPKIWMTMLVVAAALAFATGGPGTAVAADTNGNGSAKSATPAPANGAGEESLDPDEKKAADEAFKNFQATIDMINENIGKEYGGAPFPKMVNPKPRVAKITPTKAWMDVKQNHYRNAMMLYRMWRNANQFHPVTLMITDDKGGDYITVKDTPEGLEYRAKQE